MNEGDRVKLKADAPLRATHPELANAVGTVGSILTGHRGALLHGLTGQPRAVVQHIKAGREHTHIVWARVDVERSRVISDSHNFRRHELIARELEREFNHEAVKGMHIGRQGGNRPQRTPGHDEMQQAARTGITPAEARAQITALWRSTFAEASADRSTATGQQFAAALKDAGWTLCRGDRRDFVLVDSKGGIHGLARRLDGVNASSIRQRLADIDPASLPNVTEARASIRALSPPPAELVRLKQSSKHRSGLQDGDRRDDGGGASM